MSMELGPKSSLDDKEPSGGGNGSGQAPAFSVASDSTGNMPLIWSTRRATSTH